MKIPRRQFLHLAARAAAVAAMSRLASAQAYRPGPSRDWIKVKNPDCPAMIRARDNFERLEQ
jgi:hypothetical protein